MRLSKIVMMFFTLALVATTGVSAAPASASSPYAPLESAGSEADRPDRDTQGRAPSRRR